MRRTRIESFKTWRGGFTYLIIRKGLIKCKAVYPAETFKPFVCLIVTAGTITAHAITSPFRNYTMFLSAYILYFLYVRFCLNQRNICTFSRIIVSLNSPIS